MWWIFAIVGWFICGLIAGSIAISKGHSGAWFLVGFLLGLIGIFIALALSDENEKAKLQKQISDLKKEKSRVWMCEKCGTQNDPSNKFCKECGTERLNNPDFEEWRCAKCGNLNSASSKFCGKCGVPKEGNVADLESIDLFKCLKCGKVFSKFQLYCPECGAKKGDKPEFGLLQKDLEKEWDKSETGKLISYYEYINGAGEKKKIDMFQKVHIIKDNDGKSFDIEFIENNELIKVNNIPHYFIERIR